LINEFGLKYNKALVCPENNSYGFATILKLLEINYPRMYHRKSKNSVYLGTYVPKSSAESAGFNTNGKTRGTILSKLEEVIRNKQLICYSSRFYEELKVFTWQSGRAQAKRGFNDDLVMSLAIGSWLFDASADYSKSSKAVNDAMIKAFSVRKNKYTDTPDSVLEDVSALPPFMPTSRDMNNNNIKQNIKNTLKRSNIPKDMLWIFK